MTIVLLIARLLRRRRRAVAGITKLADRSGSRQAIIGFGLPSSIASPLGVLLPPPSWRGPSR